MTRTGWCRATLVLVAIAGLALLTAAPALAQSVTTDKTDYMPGWVVTITGSGWSPGETVSLTLTEDPPANPAVSLSAVADAGGNFTNADFIVPENALGTSYTVTATGQTSLLTAQVAFTDAIGKGSLCNTPIGTLGPIAGCAGATALPKGNPVKYDVGAGSTITGKIIFQPGTSSSAFDAFVESSGSCAGGVWVAIQSTLLGNTFICGGVSGDATVANPKVVTFTWAVPSVTSVNPDGAGICTTVIASYKTLACKPQGNNPCTPEVDPPFNLGSFKETNNDIVDDGKDNGSPNSAAGYRIADQDGNPTNGCNPAQQQSTTTVTAIHNDGNHTTDIKGQTIVLTPTEANPTPTITVHDQATITGASSPPTGTVKFSFFTNSTCTTPASLTSAAINLSTGTTSGNSVTVDATSFAQTLGAGSFSFQATYTGGNGTSSTSTCETLFVASTQTTPSIATQIHKDPHVNITGTTETIYYVNVHDHATVMGSAAVGTPTGSVTFHKFSTNNCTGTATDETVGLSAVNASTADAVTASFVPTTAGFLSYTADYGGDCCYTPVSTTGCELLTLDKIQPSLATVIHFTDHSVATPPITFGATVHDAATASAPNGNLVALPAPSGNVDFTFRTGVTTGQECTTGAASADGSAAVNPWSSVINGPNSGTADGSNSHGPLAVGSYAFSASYDGTGDAVYKSAASACEPFAVQSSISDFHYNITTTSNYGNPSGPWYCHTLDPEPAATVPPGTGGPDPATCPSSEGHVQLSTRTGSTFNNFNNFLVTVTITNNTGGSIFEKVQGGLAASDKATYLRADGITPLPVLGTSANGTLLAVPDTTCGAAVLNLSAAKTSGGKQQGNVVIWGDGTTNTNQIGFAMAQGQVCTLQVVVRKAYTNLGNQAVTSSWSETQTGPGTFSGKSPYTGSLLVEVDP